MTNTDLFSIYASNSGGIGSLAGTITSITLDIFDIDTCKANTNNGGGWSLTNSAATTMSITDGKITAWCRA